MKTAHFGIICPIVYIITLQLTKLQIASCDPMIKSSHVYINQYLESSKDERRRLRKERKLHDNVHTHVYEELNSGWQYEKGDQIKRRRNLESPPIDYGGEHPYEKKRNKDARRPAGRDLLSPRKWNWYDPSFSVDDYIQDEWYPDDHDFDYLDFINHWQNEVFDWVDFRPIRIEIDTRHLIESGDEVKNEFVEYILLPAAIQFWTKALMVYPAKKVFVDNTVSSHRPHLVARLFELCIFNALCSSIQLFVRIVNLQVQPSSRMVLRIQI